MNCPKKGGRLFKTPEPKLANIGKEMPQEEKTPTPEELEKEKQEEEELLATPKEERVRSQIIENLGDKLSANTELVDKLVKSKLEDMKVVGKVVGQKRGWREKALKKSEEKPTKPDKKPEKKVTDDKWRKRMDFVTFNRDLSKDEVNEVIAYAEGKEISYEEALKSPLISLGIKSLRAKAKAEKETPPPSKRTPKPGETKKKDRKYPSFEDWRTKKRAKSVE